MIGTIESIYRTHRNGLYTLALSITGRAESAEDAVHDAVVRLWRETVRPAGDPVAYVFAAVRNAALDVVRRRPVGGVSIFDVPDPTAIESDGVMFDERAAVVSRALAELPPEQREAIVLHLYAGLTFAQVAESLDVPLQTIASRYRRGLERLKPSLASLT